MSKLLVASIIFVCTVLESVCGLDSYAFPEDFIFGVATASYQIEGAWNVDGKGENIWDRLTHQRSYIIRDGSNGDVACNSYYKFKEDVQLLTSLKVNFYRFSLSWARILPNGLSNSLNQNGIDYYNNVINELIENGIMPMITIYHWDLPQSLQDIGGWANPKIIDYYTEFARVVFENFADRVPYWITFNEPNPICRDGYGDNYYAPALGSSGLAEYYCAYHLLKAHASVYHLFNDKYRSKLNGKIGLAIDMAFYYPHSDSDENLQAQENALQFTIGLYLHPIYHSNGDYPEIVKNRIAERSNKEGFTKSRLPSFTSEELHYIRASADFLGVNHYTSYVAQYQDEPAASEPKFEYDRGFYQYQSESWNETASDWFRVVPEGFKKLLIWIADEYSNPEMIITENGFSDTGELTDDERISYYRNYLSAMIEAVYEYNVNVTGYTAWSLLDNFEWTGGYLERFGMYQVDFEDDDRPRTEKASAQFYREVITKRCVVGKQNCE